MLQKAKTEIAKLIAHAAGVDEERALASIELPKNSFGDLSSRIAFELAKEHKKNPVELAKEMAGKIRGNKNVEKVLATGPYINFFLSSDYFCGVAEAAAKDREYGKGRQNAGKIIVEFPSVNPNKPWHIGHLRNALLGDSVARILGFCGNTVESMDYIDDLGLQAGQSLYQYTQLGSPVPDKKFDHWVGEQYVQIAEQVEKDPETAKKVRETLKKMEEGGNDIAQKARWLSEEVVKAQYQTDFALGIYHDVLVFESDIIKSIFHEGLEKLKESKAIHLEKEGKNAGCWVVQLGEKYKNLKDDQKIIIRSDGTATYTGKDVIFQLWKFGLLSGDFGYSQFIMQPNGKAACKTSPGGKKMGFGHASRVINIIGVEQSYPQAVIKDTLEALGYAKEAQGSVHLAYEHATLPEGKFSGRKGTWLGYTVDEFIEEAKAKAKERIGRDNVPAEGASPAKPMMGESEKEAIAEKVAIAGIKFSFLRTTPEKKLVFDWDKALSLEGDSGPYLQYAYVRTLGILNKWGGDVQRLEVQGTMNDDEKALLRHVSVFGEIVQKAGGDLRPHFIADYALELATLFSRFYTKNPVLGAENAEEREKRLAIVAATANTMRNALYLLGIEAPERM